MLPNRVFSRLSIALVLCISISNTISSQEQPFGLEEKPGEYLPQDIYLLNEDSVEFPLSPLISKPTLLVFVYYDCPELCPDLLAGVAELVNYTKAAPGEEYQIITLSIDPEESVSLARETKERVYKLLEKPVTPSFWRFLTADSANIRKLTNSVGWQFRSDGENFVHTTSTVLITPEGMISQYFYGTYFNYMHFDMSVDKAEQELLVPTRLKSLKYCYNYKPEENKTLIKWLWIYGVGIVVLVLVLFLFLAFRKNKTAK